MASGIRSAAPGVPLAPLALQVESAVQTSVLPVPSEAVGWLRLGWRPLGLGRLGFGIGPYWGGYWAFGWNPWLYNPYWYGPYGYGPSLYYDYPDYSYDWSDDPPPYRPDSYNSQDAPDANLSPNYHLDGSSNDNNNNRQLDLSDASAGNSNSTQDAPPRSPKPQWLRRPSLSQR